LDKIAAEVKAEIEEAAEFAMQSPYPEPEEIRSNVYSMDNERSVAR